MRGYNRTRFVLPTATPLAGYVRVNFVLPTASSMGNVHRCAATVGTGRGIGENKVSITWYNGQVLTFDMDDLAQKKQYEALRQLQAGVEAAKGQVPLVSYILPTDLTPPKYEVLYPVAPEVLHARTSWMDQEAIAGVKNSWLLAGAAGIFALASLRKKGGRR